MEKRLLEKRLFSSADAAEAMAISRASALVLCVRKVRRGEWLRIKRDLYADRRWWESLKGEEFFPVANRLQVPSYISFMSALAFYDLSTQMLQGTIECAAVKRSARYETSETRFIYHKLNKSLYFGFKRLKGFFIAEPEKALLDSLHLSVFKGYGLDISSLELEKFDKAKVKKMARKFPLKTRKVLERLWPR